MDTKSEASQVSRIPLGALFGSEGLVAKPDFATPLQLGIVWRVGPSPRLPEFQVPKKVMPWMVLKEPHLQVPPTKNMTMRFVDAL